MNVKQEDLLNYNGNSTSNEGSAGPGPGPELRPMSGSNSISSNNKNGTNSNSTNRTRIAPAQTPKEYYHNHPYYNKTPYSNRSRGTPYWGDGNQNQSSQWQYYNPGSEMYGNPSHMHSQGHRIGHPTHGYNHNHPYNPNAHGYSSQPHNHYYGDPYYRRDYNNVNTPINMTGPQPGHVPAPQPGYPYGFHPNAPPESSMFRTPSTATPNSSYGMRNSNNHNHPHEYYPKSPKRRRTDDQSLSSSNNNNTSTHNPNPANEGLASLSASEKQQLSSSSTNNAHCNSITPYDESSSVSWKNNQKEQERHQVQESSYDNVIPDIEPAPLTSSSEHFGHIYSSSSYDTNNNTSNSKNSNHADNKNQSQEIVDCVPSTSSAKSTSYEDYPPPITPYQHDSSQPHHGAMNQNHLRHEQDHYHRHNNQYRASSGSSHTRDYPHEEQQHNRHRHQMHLHQIHSQSSEEVCENTATGMTGMNGGTGPAMKCEPMFVTPDHNPSGEPLSEIQMFNSPPSPHSRHNHNHHYQNYNNHNHPNRHHDYRHHGNHHDHHRRSPSSSSSHQGSNLVVDRDKRHNEDNTNDNVSGSGTNNHDSNNSTSKAMPPLSLSPSMATPAAASSASTTTSTKKTTTDRKQLQSKAWYERFEDLKDYKKKHGDCLVPQKYPPNPRYVCFYHARKIHHADFLHSIYVLHTRTYMNNRLTFFLVFIFALQQQ